MSELEFIWQEMVPMVPIATGENLFPCGMPSGSCPSGAKPSPRFPPSRPRACPSAACGLPVNEEKPPRTEQ